MGGSEKRGELDFYFDFTSPYAYLAHCRLPQLADQYGYSVNYRPVDLAALKAAAGNTGPATVRMPLKLRYVMADIGRWVQRYGVPFRVGRESVFESELANKGAFFALDQGRARDYVSALWQATYGAGGSMGSEELLAEVASRMGWSPDAFLDYVTSAAATERYRKAASDAHERGVFGVPTVMLGEQMWWGNDRLDFLEECLAGANADQSI